METLSTPWGPIHTPQEPTPSRAVNKLPRKNTQTLPTPWGPVIHILPSPINNLPTDLLRYTTQFLNLGNQIQMRSVSKQFQTVGRSIINDPVQRLRNYPPIPGYIGQTNSLWQPEGHGMQIADNNERYEGGFTAAENQKNPYDGIGIRIHSDGRVDQGKWVKGEMVKGRITYTDGTIYEGDCKSGRRHGNGTCIYADGSRYEGQWKDDMTHGKGKITYPVGESYEGDWMYNDYYGKGTFCYADGTRYVGGWENNRRHGRGTFIYANGEWYSGEWKYDNRDGTGTFSYADGSYYEGQWKDHRRHGMGTFSYRNGEIRDVTFEHGKEIPLPPVRR
jgi:hypothetical protein